jgi:secondary thiamine-phosphate synthase enzyme
VRIFMAGGLAAACYDRSMELTITTTAKRQVIDITDKVTEKLHGQTGCIHVFVLHTTAAITTANLDPGTDLDLLDALDGLLPDLEWRHPHNPEHAPDHLLASIIGPDVTVPVMHGELQLGTWQRIILLEFDGPRKRSCAVTLFKS